MRYVPQRLLIVALAVTSLLAGVSTRGDTIAEHVAGTGVLGNTDFIGQSFTTTPGTFNNIAFNFFTPTMTSPIGAPFAVWSGFLFSMPYSGPAAGLGSLAAGSPGFLGQANAAGGFYTFDPNMTLLGGTQYYFYTGLVGMGTITGGGVYGGGTGYVARGDAGPFAGGVASRNFRVTGSHVPETGMTVWLMGLGALGLLGWHRLTILRGR